MKADIPSTTWSALGSTVVVLTTELPELREAAAAVRTVLAEIDRACSRFRGDSELSQLNAAEGQPVRVGALFIRATRCALRAARITAGDLDPTIGASLRAAGYDSDFEALRPGGAVRFTRAAGWRCVEVDEEAATVRLPKGVELDFGATAKALAADLAAATVAERIDGGVLVGLGGDIATAGVAPVGGWPIRVTDDHRDDERAVGQTIALTVGGLATSSTTRRRWVRGGEQIHHILDPRTGSPAAEHWRTVSVAAATCVDANIAATTAIIRGSSAAGWLESAGLPARLTARDGAVTVAAGWPLEQAAAC
jgi:FAD:protein FMN transferase